MIRRNVVHDKALSMETEQLVSDIFYNRDWLKLICNRILNYSFYQSQTYSI